MYLKHIHFKIKWILDKRKFARVGKNCILGCGYSFKGEKFISIGDNFSAGECIMLQAWEEYRGEKTGYIPALVINSNVSFMGHCHVSCANRIEIGDGVLFGDNVFVTDNFHGDNSIDQLMNIPPIERPLYIKGEVIIGSNVWIGRNVCIMPGVHIGNGAVIGANSVVTSDVSEYTIVAGTPAKVVKSRRKE